MKKLDRRIVRTRKALGDAIISLALEQGYDNFSIRDLTERADVGYATFYRHYKSKDHLLNHRLRVCFHEIAGEVRKQSSVYEECLAMFTMVDKYRDACLLGVSLPQDHPATKPIWDEIIQMTHNFYQAHDEMTIPLEVAVNHLIGAVVEMIRWWLGDGRDYSPEQMATIQSELVMNVTENVALKRRFPRQNPASD